MLMLLILLLLPVMPGCASSGEEFVAPNTDLSGRKVVVLPFSNLTTTPDAGQAITSIVLSDLRIRHPFVLLPLPEGTLSLPGKERADDFLSQNLRNRIRSMTGADAALVGTVTEYEYRAGGTTRPVTGFSWSLLSLRTGRILWAASASRMGSCFWSCRKTLSSLARDLVDEKIRELPH
jgi:hypothetical protein